MSFQNEKIGMMDEGYFVSRGDILKWLNDLLMLNLTKIEQLGSGAVYCQVVDVVHPGKIAMNKVNWKAKSDYQFIGNYRLLQDAFNKVGIKRYIEVEKLAKAKYQDNLQFAQWLKRYYDLNCGDRGNNYLAEERRGGHNPDFGFAQKNVVPKTYNASGAIIPKKESPPKKKQVETVQTAQTAPKKPVTTTTPHRPTTNEHSRPVKKVEKKQQIGMSSPGNRIKSNDKQVGQRQKTAEKGKKQKGGDDSQELREALEKEREEFEHIKGELLNEKTEIEQFAAKQQAEIDQYKSEIEKLHEQSSEREANLQKTIKDMEDKLLMISQILKSEEGAQLKIQMVSEVVNLPTKLEDADAEEQVL